MDQRLCRRISVKTDVLSPYTHDCVKLIEFWIVLAGLFEAGGRIFAAEPDQGTTDRGGIVCIRCKWAHIGTRTRDEECADDGECGCDIPATIGDDFLDGIEF